MFQFTPTIRQLFITFEIIKCFGRFEILKTCGNDYNTEDYLCCNGILRKKMGNQICCGTDSFSPIFYQCCNNVIRYILIYCMIGQTNQNL
jgi:hypothetical protein